MYGARPFTDQEVEIILSKGFEGVYENRNRALVGVGISTGFRVSELVSLTMRDVMHRVNPKTHVRVSKEHTKGKARSRVNQLHEFSRKALALWIDERLEETDVPELLNEYCFVSRKKDLLSKKPKPVSVDQVNIVIKQAASLAGISEDSITSHSMRKTAAKKVYFDAVEQFRSGKSMMDPFRVVQQFLGHWSLNSTISYLSFIGQETSEKAFNFKVDY